MSENRLLTHDRSCVAFVTVALPIGQPPGESDDQTAQRASATVAQALTNVPGAKVVQVRIVDGPL